MQISINTRDGTPIYQQIVEQVKLLLACGQIQVGDEMPAIRVLAEQLLINPNTVARAYRELEIEGIVEKRRTAGTFISSQGSLLSRKEKLKIITERVDLLLAEAKQMGLSLEEIQDLLNQRHQRNQSSLQKD